MTVYDAYKQLVYIPDMSIFGGTDTPLEFVLRTPAGDPVNSGQVIGKWYLSPYGQPEINILELSCTPESPDKVVVNLTKDMTVMLSGAYTHQVELTDLSNKNFRAEGVLIIHKATV